MNDKKRKEPPPGSEMPTKKSRKRAADYLSDDEVDKTVPITKASKGGNEDTEKDATKHKVKKSKKSKKNKGETLTADGVNGIVEHAGQETVDAIPSSMQAEAQRTVDTEMVEDYGVDRNEETLDEGDSGAALLAGFDSDTSDHAEDKGLDVDNLGSIPNYKKTKKKLRKIEKKGDADTPGAVYIGRIPHGFYEPQMRQYFSQFGDITRLRLSRNKRTGASKHFAFMEFKSEEVAKIVAETMDNYLMFGHILKCKFAPTETLHPDVWKGANKKFRKIPHEKLEKARLEAPKSADKWRQKNEKETKKRDKKAEELKLKLGYDSPHVKLTDPLKALEANKLEAAKSKEIEDAVAEEPSALAAIEAPPQNDVKEGKATITNGKSSTKGEKRSKKEKTALKEKAADEEKSAQPTLTTVTAAESQTVKGSIQMPAETAVNGEDDWEDDSDDPNADSDDIPVLAEAESKAVSHVKPEATAPSSGSLPVFKNPKIPKDATGKKIHRDAKGKYIPPLQRKQLARAKFAKDNPEAHKAMKKAKISDLKQKRAEKKDKRHQKMIEKFGAKNVKGGANYKSSKKNKVKAKAGGRNE